jgi:hypothetical protein
MKIIQSLYCNPNFIVEAIIILVSIKTNFFDGRLAYQAIRTLTLVGGGAQETRPALIMRGEPEERLGHPTPFVG